MREETGITEWIFVRVRRCPNIDHLLVSMLVNAPSSVFIISQVYCNLVIHEIGGGREPSSYALAFPLPFVSRLRSQICRYVSPR